MRAAGRPGVAWCVRGVVRASHQDAALSEYSDTPQYPEILDESLPARKERHKAAWRNKVTALPSLEQKMVELNMPRYYGYWSCHLPDTMPTLLAADFCQFATRTHLTRALPETYYQQEQEAAAPLLTPRLRDQVERLINLNFNDKLNRSIGASSMAQHRRLTQNFLLGLHRLLASAVQDAPHIRKATVELRPRVEAFWFLGGLPPDRMLKKTRRNFKPTEDLENDPVERPMQGVSTPFLGLRVAEGLPEVVGWDDPLATSALVPDINLDPRAFGLRFSHKHATTVTGSWAGTSQEHCQLYLHTREFLPHFMEWYGEHNADLALRQKAVVSSFSQALALATYLGFGPVTELTYPLVQQSAITDGQHWNLSVFQLNTCALHSNCARDNPRNNILWLGEEQQLFEGLDAGQVRSLNTDLLTALLAMYLKKGVTRPNPTPYLTRRLADHPALEEYRQEFHEKYLDLCSGRPHSRPKPELFLWEKIYKVDFKTRPFEPPRRFFEDHYNKKNPGQQRLDDYDPIYIPKALRKSKREKFKPKLHSEHLYKDD